MKKVIVVGAGPAGLMAAEVLSTAGVSVQLIDAMPSVGRKFLLAGKGGLNLTHSEPAEIFATRYGSRCAEMQTLLNGFGQADVRLWTKSLGIETFIGSSGRIFPSEMKAAPLLRAWLQRLRHPKQGQGVQFFMRHRWLGWANGANNTELLLQSSSGEVTLQADAVVLALGGASWPRLGSDGAWTGLLQARGVALSPLLPSNCGFDCRWSAFFMERFAGQALKSVAIRFCNADGQVFQRKGEFVVTSSGVEGSLIYSVSSLLRNAILQHGEATFYLDLLPDMSPEGVLTELQHPRGSRSLSNHLKSRLRLEGVKLALLYELLSKADMHAPVTLAKGIKALPLTMRATRPIEEAISTAGGVKFESMTSGLMLEALPGIFCAGEMLDWEAPTGGYLLTGCLASGHWAGKGVLDYLTANP